MPDEIEKYSKCILVVDDEPVVIQTFRRVFAPHPEYWMEFATTIAAGIEHVREKKFDFVFVDMKMEGQSYGGMQVLRELSKLEQQAVIYKQPAIDTISVIMTGSVNVQPVMQEAHALGIFCFMDKPADFTSDFVRNMMRKLKIVILPPQNV